MGKKPLRRFRTEAMFEHWLNSPSLSYAGVSFTDFRKDCEAGKVAGFEPEGFVGPGSDTVTGNNDGRN